MNRALLLLAGSLGLSCTAFADKDGYISYAGIAVARHSDKVLYGEHDVLLERAGRMRQRVVLYTCPDGSAFARKTVSYASALAPDFLLEDASNGMRQGIRSDGGTRVVFYGDRTRTERSAGLLKDNNLVADAGFDEFIRANWSALSTGEALPIHFLIPSRLEALSFQLQRLRSETLNGIETEVFRLKLSGIRGWMFKGIEVYYSVAEHLLVRYDGLSDLRDASLDNFETEISFAPGDRKMSSEQAFAMAREAPLAPCRQ